MQMQMKIVLSVYGLIFACIITAAANDTRIPQRLPEGPEPPLIKVNTQVIPGRYLVVGPTYKSTALIAQPKDTKVFIVYQYTGATVLKGIGYMDGDRFVMGWNQDNLTGVSTIRFRDGKGQSSWISNPGNGQTTTETWSLIDAEE
jgi:hypothetical protein